MKNVLHTFEPNLLGRDFVIGDLHGSLSCFNKLLDGIKFDKSKDRMFSVGDLVDRGPDSLGCLELLKEPWFHAVLSNHEQMMLEAFNGGYMGQYWTQNGGRWGAAALEEWRASKRHVSNELDRVAPSAESQRLFSLLPLVEELPFVLTIQLSNRKVHVIHAELPPGKRITDADLADPKKILELAQTQSHDGDYFLWGRFIFAPLYRAQMNNVEKIKRSVAHRYRTGSPFNDQLSHIISGHTILQRPTTVLGQTNIDTGAYGSYDEETQYESLTCVELESWKFYQATPTEFRQVEALTVSQEDINRLKPEFAANPGATP